MRIQILDEARDDLVEGFQFYEQQEVGLGSYFLDSLFSDIDSLIVYAGSIRWFLVFIAVSRSVSRSPSTTPSRAILSVSMPSWIAAEIHHGFENGCGVNGVLARTRTMITQEFAQQFAREWIEAWNSHDLNRILSHYSDDFEMGSPFIIKTMNEPTGALKGKQRVRTYWQRALQKMPDLKFELIEVLWSVDTICIYYESVPGLRAVEWLLIGPDGKVVKAIAHYNGFPK